ncbi:MAG: polysaccharide deacetylase family protein [Leptospira sp.]|nr:polysaccharide deacetylase family protein [Leptospira sp.]
MSSFNIPQNLCVTFHCLYDNNSDPLLVNRELFIHTDEIRNFFIFLANEGYNFCLPENAIKGRKNCVVTFDDGYFNNSLFIKIADELNIPFIIFLTGFNIENQIPFLWDLVAISDHKTNYWNTDYSLTYKQLEVYKSKLMNDSYRPFVLDELNSFSDNKLINLGYHGYYHQPFTLYGEKFIDRELGNSEAFMKKLNNKLTINHFAFPNGLFSFYSRQKIKLQYDYIYTIETGGFSIGSKFINRFSLVNPDIYGDLKSQIIKSNRLSRRLYRKFTTLKISYS